MQTHINSDTRMELSWEIIILHACGSLYKDGFLYHMSLLFSGHDNTYLGFRAHYHSYNTSDTTMSKSIAFRTENHAAF